MAAADNTTTKDDINLSLDVEFVEAFKGEADRLADVLGIFAPEVRTAGTALYQAKVEGALNTAAYTEGDLVPLSKYTVKKVPVGSFDPVPYRKITTAAAIAKSGHEAAVLRTDKKMLSDIRRDIVSKFFGFMKTGTGAATGKTLQASLANVDATLADSMEANGDGAPEGVVHFINRQDAASYLGTQPVTTQTLFGMTYLMDFLGVQRVFLTSQVEKGTVWATPTENIHLFSLDFSALAASGLAYQTQDGGLIGVAHGPAYDRASVETHVMGGMLLFPEVKDYMVKGTIAPAA
jgi:hypothetical protein|nr:MAG TPA: major capsid protein [Caudoviricetes sp.]